MVHWLRNDEKKVQDGEYNIFGAWISRTFIIKVCGIMIDGVLLEMNLIEVGMCDLNVIMDWISLGGMSIYCFVMIIMFRELKFSELDLEELICQVKRLKHILKFGMPLSNTFRSFWKFIEHRGSFSPKWLLVQKVSLHD